MARHDPAVGPPSPAAVARVPDVPLSSFTTLARATWAVFDHMWWFANRSDDPDAAGRFDLERPRGTCYFASDPVAALLEKLTDPDDLEAVIADADLDRLVVWVGTLERGERYADTSDRRSRMPKEFGAGVDVDGYGTRWLWADAFDRDGRDGIVWWLRMDPGEGRGIAVFGPASAGDNLPEGDEWPDLARLPARGFRDALIDVGLLEPTPMLDDLNVAVDPQEV